MRVPLPEFLHKRRINAVSIVSTEHRSAILELLVLGGAACEVKTAYRIFCIHPIDYAIRPMDPTLYMGSPPLEWSDDDPQLLSPIFQYIPGGDGERYSPPRKWEVITVNQSYVVAERFEIEPIPKTEQVIKNDPNTNVATFNSADSAPSGIRSTLTIVPPLDWHALAYSCGRRPYP